MIQPAVEFAGKVSLRIWRVIEGDAFNTKNKTIF